MSPLEKTFADLLAMFSPMISSDEVHWSPVYEAKVDRKSFTLEVRWTKTTKPEMSSTTPQEICGDENLQPLGMPVARRKGTAKQTDWPVQDNHRACPKGGTSTTSTSAQTNQWHPSKSTQTQTSTAITAVKEVQTEPMRAQPSPEPTPPPSPEKPPPDDDDENEPPQQQFRVRRQKKSRLIMMHHDAREDLQIIILASPIQASKLHGPFKTRYTYMQEWNGEPVEPHLGLYDEDYISHKIQSALTDGANHPEFTILPDWQIRAHARNLGYRTINALRIHIEDTAVASMVESGFVEAE